VGVGDYPSEEGTLAIINNGNHTSGSSVHTNPSPSSGSIGIMTSAFRSPTGGAVVVATPSDSKPSSHNHNHSHMTTPTSTSTSAHGDTTSAPAVTPKTPLQHQHQQQRQQQQSSKANDHSEQSNKTTVRNRLSLVVGSLRKAATTPVKPPVPPSLPAPAAIIAQEEYDAETLALQEEAMQLTWRAQAEAITISAMNGEHPCMQNFLRAPQQSADKCWVVLRRGKLFVYPHDPKGAQDVAMDAHPPLKEICLYGCSCRPMEQPNGFEIGVVSLASTKTLSQIELSRLEVQRWVPFRTEMEAQCRVWVMAIQFSATMHRYVEKEI
jgi:hypothetical protein